MSKKNYKVPQVFYGDWSDDLEPGHENYWWDIGTIAEWIGYALIGGSHGCRVDLYRPNTIHVSQTKEKFGGVRAYCHLASYEQVQEKYRLELMNITKQNRLYFTWKQGKKDPDADGYPAQYIVRMYEEEGRYPLSTPSIDEFTQGCALADARWYRRVYRNAARLWPQYESAIIDSADYYEYLFNTEAELDDNYDRRKIDIEKSDYLSDEQKKSQVVSLEEDRKYVKNVCEFTQEKE